MTSCADWEARAREEAETLLRKGFSYEESAALLEWSDTKTFMSVPPDFADAALRAFEATLRRKSL